MLLGQKLQIAFIMIVLTAAGYFYYHNTRQEFDMSINSWSTLIPKGKNTGAINAANPQDPEKLELLTSFGFSDGTLEIIQFPNAKPPKDPVIRLGPPHRGMAPQHQYVQDPLAPVASIHNSFRHALALATYHAVYQSSIGLLGSTDMTPDQRTKEADARTKMNASVKVVDQAAAAGSFHTDLVAKILAALKAYSAVNGDPLTDRTKADLARKVVQAGADYLNKEYAEKDKAIDTYMDLIAGMLSSDQQDKLIAAADKYEKGLANMPAIAGGGPTRGRRGNPGGFGGGNGAVTFGNQVAPNRNNLPAVTTSPGRRGRANATTLTPAPPPATAPITGTIH